MVDIRSEQLNIKQERRKGPRLELHCDVTIMGIHGILTITDISLSGIFIEASIPDSLNIGRLITINTKLPSERDNIRLKAKVIYKTNRGIGCQFVSLHEQQKDAIGLCFKLFKDTLPAG